MTTACSTEPDEGARLASTSNHSCPTDQSLHLASSRNFDRQPGEVSNPSVKKVRDSQTMPGDYLPIVTTNTGERIVGFPAGTTEDGQPIMAPEVAVTGLENYPYKTFQGRQGNCAPRAFEVVTGTYDAYLEKTMNGMAVESVTVGGRTFIPKPNTVKPQIGQVLDYQVGGPQSGYHAAIVTGYDENGDVIVATGSHVQHYQVVPKERIRASYHEVR